MTPDVRGGRLPAGYRRGWLAGSAAWLAASAAAAAGLVSIMTIGVLLLIPAAVCIALLARSSRLRNWWPAAIAGPAVPLGYLAYLNRSGPGTVCTTTSTASSCVQQYAPWPFLGIAAASLIVAAALWRRATR